MTLMNSGLYVQDLTVGDGAAPELGNTIFVDYAGWLPNGAEFDSATNAAFSLVIGELIDGFVEGILGMRVGGTRTLVIPPALGYGAQARPGIPANSTLVFRITLNDVQ